MANNSLLSRMFSRTGYLIRLIHIEFFTTNTPMHACMYCTERIFTSKQSSRGICQILWTYCRFGKEKVCRGSTTNNDLSRKELFTIEITCNINYIILHCMATLSQMMVVYGWNQKHQLTVIIITVATDPDARRTSSSFFSFFSSF